MFGVTRNDWFKDRMKEVLNVSGHEHLRFLSEQSHTHTHLHVTVDQRYKTEHKEMHQYTVIEHEGDFERILAHLKDFTAWCLAHPHEAAANLDAYAEDFPAVVEDAYFTLEPSIWAPGDDGQGSEFLFCVLRTVGDLLRYARSNGMVAVYRNEQTVFE